MGITTNRNNPCIKNLKKNGQQSCYLVLLDEEKAKGFIRPVRRSYRHVGQQVDTSEIRELTKEENKRYKGVNYIGFIPNEDKDSVIVGRFITQDDLKKGCGTITTMGLSIAQTYARDPKFYGATFCCGCSSHLPVGENGEFIWEGTNEKVGT